MNKAPIIIEISFQVSVSKVWQAISDPHQMKQWYFDVENFKPIPGIKFVFQGGDEHKVYAHYCEVKEAIPFKKLSYSWSYDHHQTDTLVTFELTAESENRTRLKLIHEGLDNLPADNKDFARENFADGWTHIIGIALKEFLEKKS